MVYCKFVTPRHGRGTWRMNWEGWKAGEKERLAWRPLVLVLGVLRELKLGNLMCRVMYCMMFP